MPVRGHVDAAQWAAASDANYQHAANRLEHALARRADLVAEHERLVAEAQAVVDQAIADMANQASSGLAAHLPWMGRGENEAPGQGLGSRPRPTQLRPRGLGTDGPRSCLSELSAVTRQAILPVPSLLHWTSRTTGVPSPVPTRVGWGPRSSLRALEASARDLFPAK